MFKLLKIILVILLIIAIVFMAIVFYDRKNSAHKIDIELPPAQEYEEFIDDEEVSGETEETEDLVTPEELLVQVDAEPEAEVLGEKVEVEVMPEEINLAVPFTSQAPTANWEQPWQDACEEASILMIDYYYRSEQLPSKEEVESILFDMVAWQEENYGGHYNLPTARVAEYAETTFGYKTEVFELTTESIKQFLSKGLPVIVPADGHKLDNPNFSGDGPDYHMLVVKGFADDKFITNDPGTRNGADFVYTEENLLSSIFDWDSKKDQAIGPKLGLVLYRN